MNIFKNTILKTVGKISILALAFVGVYGFTPTEKADACIAYPQCCAGGGAVVYAQICGGSASNIPWNQLSSSYTPAEYLRNCIPTNPGMYQDALGNYGRIDGCEKARAGLGTYVGTPWTTTSNAGGAGGYIGGYGNGAGANQYCGAACASVCYTCGQYGQAQYPTQGGYYQQQNQQNNYYGQQQGWQQNGPTGALRIGNNFELTNIGSILNGVANIVGTAGYYRSYNNETNRYYDYYDQYGYGSSNGGSNGNYQWGSGSLGALR